MNQAGKPYFTHQLLLEGIAFPKPQWPVAGVLVVSQGGAGCVAVVLKVLDLGFSRKKTLLLKYKGKAWRHNGDDADL